MVGPRRVSDQLPRVRTSHLGVDHIQGIGGSQDAWPHHSRVHQEPNRGQIRLDGNSPAARFRRIQPGPRDSMVHVTPINGREEYVVVDQVFHSIVECRAHVFSPYLMRTRGGANNDSAGRKIDSSSRGPFPGAPVSLAHRVSHQCGERGTAPAAAPGGFETECSCHVVRQIEGRSHVYGFMPYEGFVNSVLYPE